MKQAIERLEENFARGDTITGTATGLHDLDELLSGLQPSTLNIIGARPAMGKCVAWDTPMVDRATGELVTALRAVRERAAAAWRADGPGSGHRRPPSSGARSRRVLDDGVKPVFTVTHWSGRTVSRSPRSIRC